MRFSLDKVQLAKDVSLIRYRGLGVTNFPAQEKTQSDFADEHRILSTGFVILQSNGKDFSCFFYQSRILTEGCACEYIYFIS